MNITLNYQQELGMQKNIFFIKCIQLLFYPCIVTIYWQYLLTRSKGLTMQLSRSIYSL